MLADFLKEEHIREERSVKSEETNTQHLNIIYKRNNNKDYYNSNEESIDISSYVARFLYRNASTDWR